MTAAEPPPPPPPGPAVQRGGRSSRRRRLRTQLRAPDALRDAFVLSEILAAPVGLRRFREGRPRGW